MAERVRIFVAATPAEWLPQRVLEFSIRENTDLDVEVRALYTFNRTYELPRDLKNRPRTPFSFQRFLIPEICNFEGRAIYMDADMQVFKNISDLWSTSMSDFSIQTVPAAGDGRKGQFSVMLLDCAALSWQIENIIQQLDAGVLTYEQLMYEMSIAPTVGSAIPQNWNMLEHYEPSTALLHYTDMNTQPWVSIKNPLGSLWMSCLRRSIATGFIKRNDLIKEIHAGHVRPSLLVQLDKGIDDAWRLSLQDRRLDKTFIPPYKNIHNHGALPWNSSLGRLKFVTLRALMRFKLMMGNVKTK